MKIIEEIKDTVSIFLYIILTPFRLIVEHCKYKRWYKKSPKCEYSGCPKCDYCEPMDCSYYKEYMYKQAEEGFNHSILEEMQQEGGIDYEFLKNPLGSVNEEDNFMEEEPIGQNIGYMALDDIKDAAKTNVIFKDLLTAIEQKAEEDEEYRQRIEEMWG